MPENTRFPLPVKLPKRGMRLWWENLHGSAPALAICSAAQEHNGPLVVIAPDSLAAQQLQEEIGFFKTADLELLHFPDWETLPYDMFSPHQDIVSERLATLYRLPLIERGILILPVSTLMQRLPPIAYVQQHSLLLERHQELPREAFRARLDAAGYRCVTQVMEHGEYAVRGSVFDLFPMGGETPYRLDFFDEEIDSLRLFDPETQRSSDVVESVRLLPAREFPLNHEAIKQFQRQWHDIFGAESARCPVYRDVVDGLAPAGVEYYLPLFFDALHTLFDYLPDNALLVSMAQTMETVHTFGEDLKRRYEQLRHDQERPVLPPVHLYLQPDELFGQLKKYPQVLINQGRAAGKSGVSEFTSSPPPSLQVDARAKHPAARLRDFILEFDGRVLLSAETAGRRETLLQLLLKENIKPAAVENWQDFSSSKEPLALTVAPLEQGLFLHLPMVKGKRQSLAIIGEAQLFGERVAQRRRRGKGSPVDPDALIRDLTELSPGAPVVHEDNGVGRYLGLVTLEAGGIKNEYLHLEYAKGDKLYVPVTSLHLISRYAGVDPEHAPLHKLGNPQWEKAKRKAAERVRDVAAELLEIYARREARQGYRFHHDADAYRAFEQGFPFEETPDQQQAIEAVLADMQRSRPMDRLICGDVGFGKTEVAMRAAFVAVQDGKQVAVLVPTTLLAQQHHQTFLDRFADWPVRIEQLSRFRSQKEQSQGMAGLADGTVDIVIGTHKLIQDNIQFKNLGLVIIDEEHRFGVRQKERFKALRAEVDILTLTATPIPRSLNMALSNLRELSVIATPPSRRLTIKTFLCEWRDDRIREAVLREIKRGGQIYFLHNDVAGIEKIAAQLAAIIPEARVEIAHGQMPERELERVMSDFYHRRFNLLVCTTIIETGIDVPNANTILINRADRLGLAQLYQLRGRVGRSHHRAYAYLITPHRKSIGKDAIKRLDAIAGLENLGMGFTLATHDLEIRGAGELLGDEQSGQMQEIGYSMYTDLLERAVKALREGRQPELDRPLEHGAEINLSAPALLPEDYMPDVHTRLLMYKRIAGAADQSALDDIQVELIDRFGLLPDTAKNLIAATALKIKANALGIRKIELGESGGRIVFSPETPVEPVRLIRLVQSKPQHYRPAPGDNLRIEKKLPAFKQRIEEAEWVLGYLGG